LINVKIKILRPDLVKSIPEYMTPDSAGLDIRAAIEEDIIIKPGEFTLVPTGLAISIPSGYEVQVRPRSGLSIRHGIGLLNSPGTIDADYRGEIKIIMFNFGKENFIIKNGDRIAQLVLNKIEKIEFEIVDELDETHRNEGGFGHTGIN